MSEEKINYYSVGSISDPVISNSSLGAINPDEGGCPQKFVEFYMDRTEEKNSISLERGSLVHLWQEHRENFIVSELEKPTDMMASWVEDVHKMLRSAGLENYTEDLMIGLGEPYYKSTKDRAKRITKFNDEGMPYLKFLFEADGKIALTSADRDIVEGCVRAIQSHEKAAHLLFRPMEEGQERLKELEIYWIASDDIGEIKCKAKLDDVIIDWKNKIAYINDLKTSSKPVSKFKSSFVNFRYYRQMAFYQQAIYQYLRQNGISYEEFEDWRIEINIVAVDYTKYFNVEVFDLHPEWLNIGRIEYRSLMQRVIYHVTNSVWTETMEIHKGHRSLLDLTAKDKMMIEYPYKYV
jgi:hypothetical protein